MRIPSWLHRWIGFTLAAMALGPAPAALAAYPDKPIKLLIGFPPGGGGDLYGRAIAQELGKVLGKTVIVDNKPGAGGNIAAELMTQAEPDGYTLLLGMSGNLASSVAIKPTMPYKVPDDFVFISMLVETSYGLMVGADSKIKTIQDYIGAGKGGKLTYASTGTGGASQIVMEMVKQQGNLDVLHIPYKGSGPAITDLIAGQVDSFFAPYTPLMGQVNAGRLRLLAISTDKRVPSLPSVPTLKEAGIDVVMSQWYGLVAPKGTPQPVIDRLTQAVRQAMASPDLLKVYRGDGANEATQTGAAFRDYVLKDLANYRRAVSRGNLKMD